MIRRGWQPPKKMPDAGCERLIDAVQYVHPAATLYLTAREAQVMRWISDGYSYDQTAAQLGVSRETIKMQMKLVRQKLGARNTPHAVAIAMREGIVV